MTEPEWLAWMEFYKLYPFDDYHRFYRPAALVTSRLSGEDQDYLIGFLEKRPASGISPGISAVEQSMLKALGVKPPPKG